MDEVQTIGGDGRDVGRGDAWRPLLGVARVVVPSTFLVSLFYYFGVRFTDDHYRQYGLDDAALDFSTTDYVVRSLNVTVQPLRAVALVVVTAVGAVIIVNVSLRLLGARRPSALRSARRMTGLGVVICGLLGCIVFWRSQTVGL